MEYFQDLFCILYVCLYSFKIKARFADIFLRIKEFFFFNKRKIEFKIPFYAELESHRILN